MKVMKTGNYIFILIHFTEEEENNMLLWKGENNPLA